jgi:DNA-binding transcriptional ArsR family regulator
MPVVDLRGSPPASPPATVTVRGSAGAELLRLLAALSTCDRLAYDVGTDRLRAIRSELPVGAARTLDELGGDDGHRFLSASFQAGLRPEPADVPELLAWLEAEPDEGTRTDLTGLVRTVAAELWPRLESEAMGPVERDVAFRRHLLATGADPSEVLLDAGDGYEPAPGATEVVLLPSYWLRPWTVVGRIGDVEVVASPVAAGLLEVPVDAPPPALVDLLKALGDPGRLQLVRRMASGAISLTDAGLELGVGKPTAHHHLSVLRRAGLVTLRGTARATRYALRDEPVALALEALAAYLPPPDEAK